MSVMMISLGFFAMLALILFGLPIVVSMAAIGIVGGIAAYGVPFLNSIAPVVGGVQNDNLLTCIPLFVLLGELLLRSGIADRMYGTLGILIPPSLNMIVYGSLTSNSIGKLFIAGIIPGVLLALIFMLFIAGSALLSKNTMREEKVPLNERIYLLRHFIPPAVVFGVVMGSLYFGIATTTESAVLGVMAALFFVWRSGKMSWALMRNCFICSTRISGMNLFVVHGVRPDNGGVQDAILGAVPYAIIMILFTLLLMAAPGLATWLPAQM